MEELAQTPICGYCELWRMDADPDLAIATRDRAAEIRYSGDVTAKHPDIADQLVEELGITPELAVSALKCVDRVKSNKCSTAEIGFVNPQTIGITTRKLRR